MERLVGSLLICTLEKNDKLIILIEEEHHVLWYIQLLNARTIQFYESLEELPKAQIYYVKMDKISEKRTMCL